MGNDLLSIVETAYAPSDGEDAWIQRTLDALAPHFDHGMGVFAHSFLRNRDGFAAGAVRASDRAAEGFASAFSDSFGLLRQMPPAESNEILRRLYPLTPTVGWQTELSGLGPEFLRALAVGVKPRPDDVLGIVASEPSGHGCVFVAPVRGRHGFSRQARNTWAHIASHLAAAHRLARRSRATRAVDRARGRLRRADPEEAVAVWMGLVRGRWSLVEQFDHDGRRYVVAKRNPPRLRAWSTLTKPEAQVLAYAAEGQPHKVIAYGLGLSVSRVALHLARAARKVGARSRLDLVAAYRASWTDGVA